MTALTPTEVRQRAIEAAAEEISQYGDDDPGLKYFLDPKSAAIAAIQAYEAALRQRAIEAAKASMSRKIKAIGLDGQFLLVALGAIEHIEAAIQAYEATLWCDAGFETAYPQVWRPLPETPSAEGE